jgi:hypothetical protein
LTLIQIEFVEQSNLADCNARKAYVQTEKGRHLNADRKAIAKRRGGTTNVVPPLLFVWCPRSDSNGHVLKDTGPQPAVYANSTTGADREKYSRFSEKDQRSPMTGCISVLGRSGDRIERRKRWSKRQTKEGEEDE